MISTNSYLPASFKGKQNVEYCFISNLQFHPVLEKKSMPEYTSMMEVILEIAHDDQDLPVDDQLVRIRAFLPNQAFEHLSLWPQFFIVPILYSSS